MRDSSKMYTLNVNSLIEVKIIGTYELYLLYHHRIHFSVNYVLFETEKNQRIYFISIET